MAATATAIGVGVGAVSTVGSMISGSESSDSADAASEAASALATEQASLAKLLRQRYEEKFVPVENALIEETNKTTSELPGYTASMAKINQSYRDKGANLQRTLGGRYQYGSGLESLYQDANERNRIKANTSNYSDWDTTNWTRKYNLANMGRSITGQAQTGLSNAASTETSLANMYTNSANSAYSSAGSSLGNLAQTAMLSSYLNKGSGSGSYNPYMWYGLY